MPASADDYLTPPSDFSLTSNAVYRFWLYTASDDRGDNKGDLSICLHGALGSVWVQQMQKMTPSKVGSTSVFDSNKRCELYVQAQDVGTLHRLTVAYAHGKDEKKCSPWKLSQVLVRRGGDGVVTVFPASSAELKPPAALLELVPRMSWHEDLFGNLSEAAPPPPPTGQWQWPAGAHFDMTMRTGVHDDHARASEQQAFQLKLYEAILQEELLPLVDEAVHDVTMTRTPGSFLHGCAQCVAGSLIGSEAALGTMEALRKYNSQLQKQVTLMSDARGGDISGRRSELEMAQEHLRKLKSENAALRDAMERSEQQRKAAAQQQDDGQTAATKSAVCLIS